MKQPSFLSTDSIRRHPTNNSTSKNACHFSKQQRFPSPRSICGQDFYEKTTTLSKRRTSFGLGTKSDFTKTISVSPGCASYSLKSGFENGSSKGKSFGNSREEKSNKSYHIPQLKRVPGPGQYESQKGTKISISYTTRSRTLDFIDKNLSFKKSPGPGNYQTVDMDPASGRFTVSKYGSFKLAKINTSSPRFQRQKERSPGPLNYKEIDGINGTGKYHNSKFRTKGKAVFALSKRINFTDERAKLSISPGPGQYISPSEFGQYGSSIHYRTIKNFQNPEQD